MSRDAGGSRARDGDAQNSKSPCKCLGRRPRPGQCLCCPPRTPAWAKGVFHLSPRLNPLPLPPCPHPAAPPPGTPSPQPPPQVHPASPLLLLIPGSSYATESRQPGCALPPPVPPRPAGKEQEGFAALMFPQMVAQSTDLNLSNLDVPTVSHTAVLSQCIGN